MTRPGRVLPSVIGFLLMERVADQTRFDLDFDISPTQDVVMTQGSASGTDDNAWAAFEAEALPHVDALFRLAMWLERNRSEAEDLVQETMLRALRSFQRFRPGTNCRAWLVTILRHLCSNRRRARGRFRQVDGSGDRIEQTIPFVASVPQHLTDEDMLAALRRIPVAFQEVIVLCDVEELTYREIAGALKIPVGTVMSRLHRGRALLRATLGASIMRRELVKVADDSHS